MGNSLLYLGAASPQTRPKLLGADLNLIWADAAMAKCRQTQVTDQSPGCTHCTVYTLRVINTIYIDYTIFIMNRDLSTGTADLPF